IYGHGGHGGAGGNGGNATAPGGASAGFDGGA
ncbi:PE family protein, partial [Mycobacterium tuberculosis]